MTDAEIDDITLRVYRARLDASCKGDADSQLRKDAKKHGDTEGRMQRNRSLAYRPVVIEVLVQAGLHTRPIRVAPKKSAEVSP